MTKYFFPIFLLFASSALATDVSITMDDPNLYETPLLSPKERNAKILKTLDDHKNLKVALFVCGMRVDSPDGKSLLNDWDQRGHTIANHSCSHLYYNTSEITYDQYSADFLKGETIVSGLQHFRKIFRFPLL